MAQPSTRQEDDRLLPKDNGYPVLEINVADEQIDDLLDDAIGLPKKDTLMAYTKHIISIRSLKQILTEVELEVEVMIPLVLLQQQRPQP